MRSSQQSRSEFNLKDIPESLGRHFGEMVISLDFNGTAEAVRSAFAIVIRFSLGILEAYGFVSRRKPARHKLWMALRYQKVI